MTVGQFARAKRTLRKSARYLAARSVEAGRWRAQRPWSAVVPKLVTTRTLLRESGAADVEELWKALTVRPLFLSRHVRTSWTDVFKRSGSPAARAIHASSSRRSEPGSTRTHTAGASRGVRSNEYPGSISRWPLALFIISVMMRPSTCFSLQTPRSSAVVVW